MSELKKVIMEMVSEILSEDKFKSLNLDSHTKGMEKYSHGPNSYGFIDKTLKSGASHKAIHKAAKDAGYRYTAKNDSIIGGKEMTYHSYEKSAGPYSDHKLTVTTPKGSDKVWNIQHQTV